MNDIEEIYNNSSTRENYVCDKISDSLTLFVKELTEDTYNNNKEITKKILSLRKKYHIDPRKSQISFMYRKLLNNNEIEENKNVEKHIKSKSMRGLSGVIVISVITSPYPEYIDSNNKKKKQRFSCKHDCFYCPRELDKEGKEKNPRSYLSDEPTVARGLQNNFDPIKQYNDRATQYFVNGHYVDKIEIIVLGGTWTEYPREYQEDFITKIFWSANTFFDKDKRKILSLTEEQHINETSKSRIIGLTLEMRPDSINKEEIEWLRYLGCTRVQLGIQHIRDDILRGVNRGCYLEDSINALQLLKDNCFKVDAHWMPDLPGSSPEIDKEMFKFISQSDELQFDQWKVYPTTIVPWTKIKDWHDRGKYIPYTDQDPENLIDVLLEMKRNVPPWIRLNRVIRDIPNTTREGEVYIYGGNKVTNLRQILLNRLEKQGSFCPCIRCREVKDKINLINYSQILVRKYDSSGGEEYFISIESGNHKNSKFENGKWYSNNKIEPGIIYGFLRLRLSKNNESVCFPELINSALIRELHVYGQVTSDYNKNNHQKAQNNGFGKLLMKKAEEISLNKGYNKISVISGIGVRNYYRKLGYELKDTYMVKELSNIYNKINLILLFIIMIYHFIQQLSKILLFGIIIYNIFYNI